MMSGVLRQVDVAIIGAGSAGLFALSVVRQHTDNFVMINGGTLGTTCARVGCMPSKVLIQAAEDFHRREVMEKEGLIGSSALRADIPAVLRHVRSIRDFLVGKIMTNRVAPLKAEKKFIDGFAKFVSSNVLEVNDERIEAKKVIIATGSRPVVPAPWKEFSEQIMTTDSIFEQEDIPESVAVLGLGVIGLEIGQALSRLGCKVVGVDMLPSIGGLTDPEASKAAISLIGQEFPIHLGVPAQLEHDPEGSKKVLVRAGEHSFLVDKILLSVGRAPNINGLGLENVEGMRLTPRGMPVDIDTSTMQIGDFPIFIAGDCNGQRPILHEASDEGKISAYNATHDKIMRFSRKTMLGVVFCDPNIATVGASWKELEGRDDVVIGTVNMQSSGRALVMGRNAGIIRIYAQKRTGLILGASLVCTRGEHLAHEIAWAIERRLTLRDMINFPFYHPVIEEHLENALINAYQQAEMPPEEGILGIEKL